MRGVTAVTCPAGPTTDRLRPYVRPVVAFAHERWPRWFPQHRPRHQVGLEGPKGSPEYPVSRIDRSHHLLLSCKLSYYQHVVKITFLLSKQRFMRLSGRTPASRTTRSPPIFPPLRFSEKSVPPLAAAGGRVPRSLAPRGYGAVSFRQRQKGETDMSDDWYVSVRGAPP